MISFSSPSSKRLDGAAYGRKSLRLSPEIASPHRSTNRRREEAQDNKGFTSFRVFYGGFPVRRILRKSSRTPTFHLISP